MYLSLPLKRIIITSPFGKKRCICGEKSIHYGVDFAGEEGEEIFAVCDGTILRSGRTSCGYGNYVILDNGKEGFLYAHLQEQYLRTGDYVKKGEIIGFVGGKNKQIGEKTTGSHLHFEAINLSQTYKNEKTKICKTIREWIIEAENCKADANGCKPVGINGKVGRYNPFTGKDIDGVKISDAVFG